MPETTDKKKITIFVNNSRFETDQQELEGLQIKRLAQIPVDSELCLWFRAIRSEPIADNQVVHVHNEEHFRAIPAGTFGANVAAS